MRVLSCKEKSVSCGEGVGCCVVNDCCCAVAERCVEGRKLLGRLGVLIFGFVTIVLMMAVGWPSGRAEAVSKQVVSAASECKDVEIIFARGSGEKSKVGLSFLEFKSDLDNKLKRSKITYRIYDLGSEAHGEYQYPAKELGLMRILGAYISAGNAYSYGRSVAQGVGELKTYVSEVAERCGETQFVVAGYSQGAQVVARALDDLPEEKIIYMATFGDPKLYLPEGRVVNDGTQACRGEGMSEYREDVADCWVHEGILGAKNPYRSEKYIGKVGVWCNMYDFMCGSQMVLGDSLMEGHEGYVRMGKYKDAATKICQKIKEKVRGGERPSGSVNGSGDSGGGSGGVEAGGTSGGGASSGGMGDGGLSNGGLSNGGLGQTGNLAGQRPGLVNPITGRGAVVMLTYFCIRLTPDNSVLFTDQTWWEHSFGQYDYYVYAYRDKAENDPICREAPWSTVERNYILRTGNLVTLNMVSSTMDEILEKVKADFAAYEPEDVKVIVERYKDERRLEARYTRTNLQRLLDGEELLDSLFGGERGVGVVLASARTRGGEVEIDVGLEDGVEYVVVVLNEALLGYVPRSEIEKNGGKIVIYDVDAEVENTLGLKMVSDDGEIIGEKKVENIERMIGVQSDSGGASEETGGGDLVMDGVGSGGFDMGSGADGGIINGFTIENVKAPDCGMLIIDDRR